MKGDFQIAISFIGDNILVTFFDSYYESIFEGEEIKENIKYNTKKRNKGSSGVIIVAIVLVCIFSIGAIIAILIIFRKNKVKQDNHEEESTLNNFNLKK